MKLKISLAVTTVFLLAISLVSAAIPPAEDLLPMDTLAMLTVPDFSAMRVAMRQSSQGLLWNDPAMKPFRDDFDSKWEAKFLGPLEQSLGVKVDDYLPLLQGQLTIAVIQNGWDGAGMNTPSFVLLLDAKDRGDLLATNLAALKQQWIAAGKSVRTENLEGIKFSEVTLSTNATIPFASVFPTTGGSLARPPILYIGQFKSLLIVGTSIKAAASVASHLNGGASPSLAQNAQFAKDQLLQFHNGPLYYGWFNAKAFFDVLAQVEQNPGSGSLPVSWNEILLASGLKGLKSVSFAYRDSRQGAEIELYAAAPESERAGLLKIVTAAPKVATPPPFVPADAVKFWRWRVDGQKSWGELQKTLETVSPTALTSLNSFLEIANATAQQQDPNFDIRKDLINNLGDDWMSYTKASPDASLADLNSEPWLFLFAANNADQAALALKTLAGLTSQGSSAQSRDFLGRKIYTIPLPAPRGTGGGAGASRSIYCAASGGYVAITTDVSMIENYLRSDDGKTKPLSQKPGLLEAAQHVGGMNNGLFGYQNQRETARALFAALKNDPAVGATALNPLSAMPFSSAGNGMRDLMDFSLLPDYDRIAKYFNFTVYAGTATSQGLDFKFFQPRSPELN